VYESHVNTDEYVETKPVKRKTLKVGSMLSTTVSSHTSSLTELKNQAYEVDDEDDDLLYEYGDNFGDSGYDDYDE